jgi:predicted ATPase/class 3 adenylate cyclase
MSVVCPSCGEETPEGFPRCANCGAPLTAEPTAAREERKVVTVLFADLVGFTSRAEKLDPEDVRAILGAYHERVRAELERHGGTVEKFIGDAVMALFGAPVAHEDDPERAVRSALAIKDAIGELNEQARERELHVRIGITTGEALVNLGARPESGEGMAAGDVVNTAARLQAAAPTDGILVDDTTYRATSRAIDYGEAQPVDAKGKAEPVAAFEALEARARFGVDVRQIGRSPLVGRRRELDALIDALERVRHERQPQLVTLVGEPGIGKSRLVYELFQEVDAQEEMTFWRQGRSLPYGDGVSFWALGEMVKAQAGVLDTDATGPAEQKLQAAVASLVADPADAQWLERHLRPLVGLESTGAKDADRRNEAFAAWRRFFEALAEQHALVLVFEDLHFADDGMLDFVDHLVDWASGVPILVVGTARPELLARRSGWGGGKPNALTLSLSPLSDEETAQLVHSLLDRPVLDAEVQEALLDRAGGNPLYAEEFVRVLDERQDNQPPLPETVQGLIAARIDALPPEEKTLLQDAAVLGKVFWLGAAAELGRVGRWAAEERLHALERKEFVRRERRSSVAGETEYAFRHLLVRDVAYSQIPRAARADKHRGAAEWIDSLGRSEDHAEMLAHHYLSALELARAAGRPIADVADAARRVFRDAGDRSFALNAFPAAARYYAEALELAPAVDRDRPELLFRRAHALYLVGDETREQALTEASEASLATGNDERAAEAEALLAEYWWHRGNRDRSREHLDRARALVADLPSSAAKARVLSQASRYLAIAEESEEAIRVGGEALAMAETLELPEIQAHALNNIGIAKSSLGDYSAGTADLERSIEIALAVKSPEAARGYNNLASVVWDLGDFRRACVLVDEAVRIGEELGNTAVVRYSGSIQIQHFFPRGEWTEGLRRADEFIAACEAGESHYMEHGIRGARARARLARGDIEGALDDVAKMIRHAREVKDPQAVHPSLALAARIYVEAGRLEEARQLTAELLPLPPGERVYGLSDLTWVAPELQCVDELRRLLAATPLPGKWPEVQRALLDRDFLRAADLFDEIGDLEDEADARVQAARELLEQGRRPEADVQLQKALAFYRSVDATRYIREAESLLAAAS